MLHSRPMKPFQLLAVEDVDLPDFETKLSPENRAYVASVGKAFLKELLRGHGLPEKRPRLVPSGPGSATKSPSQK